MPLYEYICKDCGAIFDIFRSFAQADDPLQCKHCASPHTQRKLATFFAQSEGRSLAGSGESCNCGSCSGGSCGSCHH